MLGVAAPMAVPMAVTPTVSSPSISFTATPDAALATAFAPRARGWLGADGSTSLKLNASHHLWLFADTDWGTIVNTPTGERMRQLEAMPHNSLAITPSAPKIPQPVFFVRRFSTNHSIDRRGFFRPPLAESAKGIYYWVVAGTLLPQSGQLLALAQVQGPGGLGDFRGTAAIKVSNFTDADPQRWPYTTSHIAQSSRVLSWNNGVLAAADGYVYLIGMREDHGAGGRTQQLARIDEAALVRFDWDAMRFYSSGGGGWQPDASAASTLYPGPYTEGTLMIHPLLGYYVVGCQAYQADVIVYRAPNVTGPWTAHKAYTLPPLARGQVAYSAKSHPELARRDDEIVFSYNINAANESSELRNLSIYHPRFVRLRIRQS